MLRALCVLCIMLFTAGCTSYGVVANEPRKTTTYTGEDNYSFHAAAENLNATTDTTFLLSFSGGGTRAAALAYGVLLELRETKVMSDGKPTRLLDMIGVISSVSGGSFTSAYYGLHGDDTFDTFEDVFLRRNVEKSLIRSVLNPFSWFRQSGRTELAVDYYEENIFHGATFADLKRKGGPLLLINASDLGYGVRFSFVQEYFNLLCSDIASYSIARAVTASSAVPVLFHPVVLRNYDDCKSEGLPAWLQQALQRSKDDPQLSQTASGLTSFFKTSDRDYAHFVDGGITDNLGLRAVYDFVEMSGGAKIYMEKYDLRHPKQMIVISVDASTDPEPVLDRSNKQPSMKETVTAMSDIQLHRYNAATLSLMDESLNRWAAELSTPEQKVTPYFIRIGFEEVADPEQRKLLNNTPTTFSLTDEQVDRLIAAGRSLLRNDPQYQKLLSDMGGKL